MIIFERKTLNDLSASIKDGRYDEQSYRLDGIEHPNHNITYLIEGSITPPNCVLLKERSDKAVLYSAMCSICYFKGFTVMRSFDMSESASMICYFALKLMKSKNKQLFYQEEKDKEGEFESVKDEKKYCSVVKRVKKDNITKENIGEIMLCQIPGVSSQTAYAIFNKFKNINNLLINIQQDKNCLNDVCTTDNKNKSRKISKKTIENIILFLSE